MIHSTYYATLGLDDHERAAVIRGAYRDLVRRFHPARVGPGGGENFRAIADAYRILSDSSLRRSYDEARSRNDGASARRASTATTDQGDARPSKPLAPPIESLSLRRAPLAVSCAGEAMLARFARNFTGVGVPKSESADCLTVRLIIARSDREEGVMIRLGLPVLVRCDACAGHGAAVLRQCRACDGDGFVESERAIAVTIAAAPADGSSSDLSLAPLGIHNFYLHAVVQFDPTLN